jgi:hypothetical protein
MESATEDANKGRHEKVVAYREYEPIVTIPLRSESLNLVN